MGFASVYEEEIHIKIVKGIVQKLKTIDNCLNKRDEGKLAIDIFPGSENYFDGDNDI